MPLLAWGASSLAFVLAFTFWRKELFQGEKERALSSSTSFRFVSFVLADPPPRSMVLERRFSLVGLDLLAVTLAAEGLQGRIIMGE